MVNCPRFRTVMVKTETKRLLGSASDQIKLLLRRPGQTASSASALVAGHDAHAHLGFCPANFHRPLRRPAADLISPPTLSPPPSSAAPRPQGQVQGTSGLLSLVRRQPGDEVDSTRHAAWYLAASIPIQFPPPPFRPIACLVTTFRPHHGWKSTLFPYRRHSPPCRWYLQAAGRPGPCSLHLVFGTW